MMYLSGCVPLTMLANPRPDLGIMLQPGIAGGLADLAKALPFWRWAADNGCYAQGDRFDAGDWLEWLASLRRYRSTCLFAVAPDVFGDGPATLDRAQPFLPTLRQLGYPAAFVAQPGTDRLPLPWDAIDALFVGGPNEWQHSEACFRLVAEAKRRGKWAHRGRVNSLARLRATKVGLYDSADGTFVRSGPDRRLPDVYDWLDALASQAAMGLAS